MTIYDVAQAAAVSIATVSRALSGSGRVSDATRKRVLDAVQVLGYEPNSIARSLVTRATQTIGLLLPDIMNPFFPELVRGVQLVAAYGREDVLIRIASQLEQAKPWVHRKPEI